MDGWNLNKLRVVLQQARQTTRRNPAGRRTVVRAVRCDLKERCGRLRFSLSCASHLQCNTAPWDRFLMASLYGHKILPLIQKKCALYDGVSYLSHKKIRRRKKIVKRCKHIQGRGEFKLSRKRVLGTGVCHTLQSVTRPGPCQIACHSESRVITMSHQSRVRCTVRYLATTTQDRSHIQCVRAIL